MSSSFTRSALLGLSLIMANAAHAEIIRTAVPRASLNYVSIYVPLLDLRFVEGGKKELEQKSPSLTPRYSNGRDISRTAYARPMQNANP